jgi:hypothetical protein
MDSYVSKEEYTDWCYNSTTQKLKEHIVKFVTENRLELSRRCGKDSNEDRFYSGLLKGIEMAWDLENFIDWSENDSSSGSQTAY